MSLICLFTCVFLKAHLLLYASPCLCSRYMSRIPVTSFNLVSSLEWIFETQLHSAEKMVSKATK